jgi:hypothetical protein
MQGEEGLGDGGWREGVDIEGKFEVQNAVTGLADAAGMRRLLWVGEGGEWPECCPA